MDNNQKLFADIVKQHTKRPDFIKLFSWGSLNFTTKIIDINGESRLNKIYSDVTSLMDSFAMMSYEMPIEYTKVSQKEHASGSIIAINGWELTINDSNMKIKSLLRSPPVSIVAL